MMYRPHSGFTLVETLVAIAVLMITIVGPLYSVNRALQNSYVARDQLIASALGQEGAEYIRGVRDGNYLYNIANPSTPVNWLNGLANCRTGNICTVDPTGNTPIAICPSGVCTPLNMSSAGLYTQASGYPATRFTRSVQIADVSATEITITVTVAWMTGRVPYSVVIVEHLTNWL